MKAFLSSLVAVAVVSGACGGQTIGGIDASDDGSPTLDGGHCVTAADCGGSGQVCGFPEVDQCSALGQCFASGPVCNLFSPGCACNGETVNIACNGLPNGYAPAPLLHAGTCGDASTSDGGGPSYTCGNLNVCIPGSQICYLSALPDAGMCVAANGCTDCGCAQAMFQCISTCNQVGQEIYVHCQ